MPKKIFFITASLLYSLFIVAGTVDLPMQGYAGTVVEIVNAQAVGQHDPSQAQTSWETVCDFEINSTSSTGFEVTAQLQGIGWSHYGTGTTQGTNYNVFTNFRLRSFDTTNYNGSKSIWFAFFRWIPLDTNPKTFSNGTQSATVQGLKVLGQARWDAAPGLLPGAYTQTLSLTIAPGS